MTEYCVVCIDDEAENNSDRARAINLLHERDELALIKLHPNQVMDWLQEPSAQPHMFVVDFRLNAIADANGKTYPFNGTALIGMVRDVYPQVPVYLVSAFFTESHSAKEVEIFDRKITQDDLVEQNFIRSDVEDFSLVAASTAQGIDSVLQLLQAPVCSLEDISQVLPRELSEGLEDEVVVIDGEQKSSTFEFSGIVRFARWVQRPLLTAEGILCSDLHASVLLGMEITYFTDSFLQSEIGREFIECAAYNGIFSFTSERRWWKQAIFDFVYSRPNAQEVAIDQLPRCSGEILEVPTESQSICVVCSQPFPEVVARSGEDIFPAHRSCSEIDSKTHVLPYFDHPRIILEA